MPANFLRRTYGSLVMAAHLPGQARMAYLPAEQIHEIRDARIRELIKYASVTVPYYRDFFRDSRLDPADIRTAADLRRLPVVDKADVRRDPARFLSESRRAKTAVPLVTSGSTGEPLRIWHDRRSLLAHAAYGARERSVARDYQVKDFDYRILQFNYPGSTSDSIWTFYRNSAFVPSKPDRVVVRVSEPLESVFEIIDEFRPDVLVGYGGYLDMLFRTAIMRNRRIHLPKLIRSGAESMPPGGRDLIEKKLGVPVSSYYGLVECLKVGFECGRSRDFHLHEDLCHIRIIKPDGEEASPDEKGEVVVSNLVNHGTVLFNYRTGDMASRSSKRCTCGRTGTLLSELEGRVEDIIVLEDGDFVHPRAIWSAFKDHPEIIRFQLIQHTASEFEIKMVTRDRKTFDSILPRILSKLKDLLGMDAGIESRYCRDLLTPEEGKFRMVKSLCNR